MAWSSNGRTLPSQGSNAGSIPVQASCPHCYEPFALPGDEVVLTGERPIGPGDFTVCLSCREIIRFDDYLQLAELKDQDWLDLCEERDLFVAMLRWRRHILTNQLRA